MSSEIAWKQNILVTNFHLLKSLLVVFGFGSQAFICGFSRRNICSVACQFLYKVCSFGPPCKMGVKKTREIIKISNALYPKYIAGEMHWIQISEKYDSHISLPHNGAKIIGLFYLVNIYKGLYRSHDLL